MTIVYLCPQEYLQALTELAPDSAGRQRSVEAATAAAKELKQVKLQLEEQRASRENDLKSEREGGGITWYCGIV